MFVSFYASVQNIGDGVGMIVQKHGHQSQDHSSFSSQPSLLGACEMKLQKYQGL